MFFGKGDTLESWLRKKYPDAFKEWDGNSMEIHVVKTKAQLHEEMICVVLMNKSMVLHKTFVIDPTTEKSIPGDLDLLRRFAEEYLPHFRHIYRDPT